MPSPRGCLLQLLRLIHVIHLMCLFLTPLDLKLSADVYRFSRSYHISVLCALSRYPDSGDSLTPPSSTLSQEVCIL